MCHYVKTTCSYVLIDFYTVSIPNTPYVNAKKGLEINVFSKPFFLCVSVYGSNFSQWIEPSNVGIFSRVDVSHRLGSTPACRQLPIKV